MKYHNKKIDSPDGKFDSKYEYEEWCNLKILEKAHIISDLRRQVSFEVIPTIRTTADTLCCIRYVADFVYVENGITVIYEVKGFKTPEYLIKKRLLIQQYVLEKGYVFIEGSKNKKIVYKNK